VVLSFQEERVVQQDWTVSWRHRRFQLAAEHQRRSLVGRRVLVCEQLDGTLRLRDRGRDLPWTELPDTPRRTLAPPIKAPHGSANTTRASTAKTSRSTRANTGTKPPWKPAADHPWRRGLHSPTPTDSTTVP